MKPTHSAAFCALLTVAAFAQSERGTITGAVSDQAHAIIPRATVRAANIETGVQYDSVTTQAGDYTISELPAGSYSLTVEAPGFSRFVQQGIRIYVAQTARIDVVLQVGGTSESVTVTAQAPLLRTENAEQSSSITRETLNDLPLNFGQRGNVGSANIRNPYTFVTLVPGGNIMSYSSIKLNGAPLDSDSIRVEGQDSNNSRLMYRQDQVQPSVEALEEISVQTSNFAPEYGQVSGGMFNLVAKSGTNQFHGSAFEYFVNEDLAREFHSPAVAMAIYFGRRNAGMTSAAASVDRYGYRNSITVTIELSSFSPTKSSTRIRIRPDSSRPFRPTLCGMEILAAR